MDNTKYLFTVWNVHRTKKVFVPLITSTEDLYEELILKGSIKLEIDGSTLVLEKNGTVIDSSEILVMLKDEIFILLQKNEIWLPVPTYTINDQHIDSISTVTVLNNSGHLELDNSSFSSVPLESCNNTEGQGQLIITGNNCQNENANTLQIINVETPILQNKEKSTHSDYDSHSDSIKSLLSEQGKRAVTENTWHKFQIPWNKFSTDITQKLNSGERINNSMMNDVVRLLVSEMRAVKEHLPQKAIDIIAHKMIAKYPKAFQDQDDDGIVVGSGVYTLAKKIQERNFYLNRLNKRKQSSDDSPGTTNKKRRLLLAARAGCTNWQPSGESSEISLEEKVKAVNAADIRIDNEFYQFLKDTYAIQRKFLTNIENPPTIQDIKRAWPVLLKKEGLFWHYEALMEHSINTLETALIDKTEKILEYGKSKRIDMTSVAQEVQVIEIVTKLLKENFQEFLSTFTKDNLQNVGPNPCILYDNTKEKYYVSVEMTIINEPGDCFLEALKLCFAFFFVFGMQYPKNTSATWEFIQRYFLKIHPDQGTKSQTFSKSKKKVLTLMKNISLFTKKVTKKFSKFVYRYPHVKTS